MNEEQKIRAFIGNFKYEGFLISDEDGVYTIRDFREGKIKLPKNSTILKFLGDGE